MKKKRPHGEIRQSQLLQGFGPGAMIDLPNHAVIVSALEHWEGERREIHEERLSRKVDEFLRQTGVKLFAPPIDLEPEPRTRSGVRGWIFPTWFIALYEPVRTEGLRSRPLVPKRELRQGEYFADDKKKYKVVPVRWVQGCPNGHISDIDWDGFAHEFQKRCKRPLWIDERGTSGDLAEIDIRCECGARRSLVRATKIGERPLGGCNGARPWIGDSAREGDCHEPARLLVRTATNTYFAQTLNVISIPDPDAELRQAVDEVWTDFLEPSVRSIEDLVRERPKPRVKAALAKFSDESVYAEIQRRRGSSATQRRGIKQTEAEVLWRSQEELGDDVPLVSNFYARALPAEKIRPEMRGCVSRVVLVHRLREVIAQVGFTRFEAETIEVDEELNLDVRSAALASETTWVPAIENRGEGVFIAFSPESIARWLARSEVVTRGKQLRKGFDAWQGLRRVSTGSFPGLPYYLLHSLSHLLISSVALECGYSASSIRERIYATEPCYGILLYTGTPDAEGTLGGLVEVGRRICDHLASAVEMGRLCSNDPVCSQHGPDNLQEERFLHGASCHGCLLIAETSCERRNDFLDRALVVPTVEGIGAEYFEDSR